MSSHTPPVPPVPPANRSNEGGKSDTEISKDQKLMKHEHHANSAEEGDTANITEDTTNKGFFRGPPHRLRSMTGSGACGAALRPLVL